MRKRIALVVALIMILSLVPLTAFAASDNTINRVPTVGEDFLFTGGVGGSAPILNIEQDSDFDTGEFIFRLNLTNAEFRESTTVDANDFAASVALANDGEVTASKRSKTSYTIIVSADFDDTEIIIPLVTKVLDEGEARVAIDPLGSVLTRGTYTFAVVAEGDTIATVTGDETVGRGTWETGTIFIDEASVSALNAETQEFRLRLPRDVEWGSYEDDEDLISTGISFDQLIVTEFEVRAWDDEDDDWGWVLFDIAAVGDDDGVVMIGDLTLPNSGRDLIVRFANEDLSGTRGTVVIDTVITVKRAARFGDIDVTLTGLEGQISNASNLTIAEYVDYGISVDVDEVIEMYAGRYDDDYEVVIEIETDLEYSLATGRWIEFEVPAGIAIVEEGTDDVLQRVNNRTFEFYVESGTEDEYEFTFVLVAEGTFVPMGETSKDLEMTINGAGIEETTIKVADVLAPVTVEVGELEELFSIGLQRQAAPEIIITENYVGAIMDNADIVISVLDQFAGSMRFDNVDYEILEGDLEIDDVEIGDDDDSIVIEIDVASDQEAAVIRLYNIEMTLDRTVPMGNFRLDIGGDALIDYEGDAKPARSDWDFAGRVARFDYFTVGTPVDPTLVDMDAVQVAFTIGQMAYMVDGEMKVMEVAPFIMNDRTMIPVRYLEELFGMQPVWNPTSRTVTVMYEGKVFEMAIGSNVMRVNGAPFMEMDAEAMIVDSRTFVPASRFARAMGIPYTWDQATQTATFN
ncbi:MAG: copper amine oxidase N-terminal domain-containing protein [Bacillota bacterium]|nr:copper amine oxidase N-terminal domain-containing protein [Bacillota bacterium]MDW7676566.1 copper amine oxidase N-terminal domain-containing protein [Bacillota bacterium]